MPRHDSARPPAPPGTTLAFFAALGAYLIWGGVGYYFKIITVDNGVGSFTLLANRVIWSVAFLVIVLAVCGQIGDFLRAMRDPKLLLGLTASAILSTLR